MDYRYLLEPRNPEDEPNGYLIEDGDGVLILEDGAEETQPKRLGVLSRHKDALVRLRYLS